MIDPKLFSVEKMLNAFLGIDNNQVIITDEPWRKHCSIIPDYMPPYPDKYTRPSVVVRFTDSEGSNHYLRHSKGPAQGHFWDCYGDDYQSPELALIALLQAPTPPYLFKPSFWSAEASYWKERKR